MTVIPVVVGVPGTIPKGLVKGIEGLEIRDVEAIKTTAWQKSARILRMSRRIEETFFYSNSFEKPSANLVLRNSQRSKLIILCKQF